MVSASGGLSAAELATETLFPGDTIEYFSMVFVAGDPRGHRVAKVLRVDRSDEDFPIRVETQEMLPLTMMLKRKRDRLAREIPVSDAKWRKLRTFRLVDGEVEGETRAQRLNAGLKKAIDDSFAAVRKQLAADNQRAKSRQLMKSFFTSAAPKEKENHPSSSSGQDDDDNFERSPLSDEKTRAEKRRSPLQPVKREPLAAASETELYRRRTGNEHRSTDRDTGSKKKRKLKQLLTDRHDRDRSHHRASSSSPRRPHGSKRDADRVSKCERLDFTSGLSNDRSLGETTAADDNDDDEDYTGDERRLSVSRKSVPHRSEHRATSALTLKKPKKKKRLDETIAANDSQCDDDDSGGERRLSTRFKSALHRSEHCATPELTLKKKRKIQLQKYMGQIQEEKSSASLNKYIVLDVKEQQLKKVIEREGLADPVKGSSAFQGIRTLQLNKNAGDAHRWKDSRQQYRESEASSDITCWLKKHTDANEAALNTSPSPSKKRRGRHERKQTPERAQERRPAMDALAIMKDEVFGESSRQVKQAKSTKTVETVKRRRPGGGLCSSAVQKRSSDGKRTKAGPASAGSSALMDKWMHRKKGSTQSQ